ncbi:MAG: biopolymer transporter ExbD [Bdellovibrionales bacterium]|nr:biopolymer transporter ExbD [Bdellovibrionales bacterium]
MSATSGEDELNLVPFIDLFSVLICFLLMTAVWMNIESLSTNASQTTSSDQDPPPPTEKPVSLSVTILGNEIQMSENERVRRLPLVTDKEGRPQVDKIIEVLGEWRNSYPNKKEVTLNTDNRVLYQTMISVFDTLNGNGWTEVGVSTQ